MKATKYDVLEMAVDSGVEAGWRHAHKHVDTPNAADIRDQIKQEVLTEICEWFDFTTAVEDRDGDD